MRWPGSIIRKLYFAKMQGRAVLAAALGGSRKVPGSMMIDPYNAGADPISTRQSSEGMEKGETLYDLR